MSVTPKDHEGSKNNALSTVNFVARDDDESQQQEQRIATIKADDCDDPMVLCGVVCMEEE